MISLEEFTKQLNRLVDSFHGRWILNNELKGNSFPLSMGQSDWLEQFEIYSEQELERIEYAINESNATKEE